jgi:hypothetical protein
VAITTTRHENAKMIELGFYFLPALSPGPGRITHANVFE